MDRRLEIALKNSIRDGEGERLEQKIKQMLGLSLKCKFIEAYNFEEKLTDAEMESLAKDVFCDLVTHNYSIKEPISGTNWRIEIGMLPGVTDNIGTTAKIAVKDRLGKSTDIHYSRLYSIEGEISRPDVDQIAALLHNPLIEKYNIYAPEEVPPPYLPIVNILKEPSAEKISFSNMTKAKFEALGKQRLLALSYEEFAVIRDYLKQPITVTARKTVGLDLKITDVELETIAQTWSEHCKHKIFNAEISYEEEGETHAINSLFKTFIRAATEQVKKPYVVSVFKDNGGIIKFNHQHDIAVKVETHNAPSALDPYGGALTGVLGVQRDVLGTGLGANPIANIDVLCFGHLDAPAKDLPKRILHPSIVFEGVVKGIEHGGNKIGIPTVNGSIVFETEYAYRPLVYCGTVGILPGEIDGRRTCDKKIEPGYLAVMVGGKIGRDGIHGATFSSMQLEATVPQSVVQIGDPITQKKMVDFIIEARDRRLYEAITDNGAGGLSSSLGEMAQISNGCEIYLEKCPLKYPGLDPWEIFLSESQERMSLAVPQRKMRELQELAKIHDVEVTIVGKFTDNGKLHVFHNDKTVAYLDLEFLHDGVPQLKLNANWKKLTFPEPIIEELKPGEVLKKLLAAPNITTKESVIRRFDQEVKGMSVIKPIMTGSTDAAVIKPIHSSNEGIVISHGICPRYVQDSYVMAAMAFDEAVRNAVATGAKFGYLACLDNFSWPDPVKSEKSPDGEYKLGQLVRSCLSLYDCAINYGIPIISGKDSMKNDYYSGDRKYSIQPTLLITVVGKIDDIHKAVTPEFKKAGDIIYVLGKTRDELGGSEYYKLFKGIGNHPPHLFPEESVPLYRALSAAIDDGLVASAHDVSDGGLAVAFSECILSGINGAELDLAQMKVDTESTESMLFAESGGRFVVTVDPLKTAKFEEIMKGTLFAKAGRIRGDKRVIIKRGEEVIINEAIEDLKEAYNKGI